MSEFMTSHILRLANGDAEAADKLMKAYFNRLARGIRQKLTGIPRRDADEEDFANSAMKSLIAGIENGKYALDNRTRLWSLLFTIAENKEKEWRRKHLAIKRGGGKVRGESVFVDPRGEQGGFDGIHGKELTPEEKIIADEVQCRLKEDNDKTLYSIARWKYEGYSNEKIAEKLGCSRQTVQNKFKRIRKILDDLGYGKNDELNDLISRIIGTKPISELMDSVVEECRSLFEELKDETLREIGLLTLEGYDPEEIAGIVRASFITSLKQSWHMQVAHMP